MRAIPELGMQNPEEKCRNQVKLSPLRDYRFRDVTFWSQKSANLSSAYVSKIPKSSRRICRQDPDKISNDNHGAMDHHIH